MALPSGSGRAGRALAAAAVVVLTTTLTACGASDEPEAGASGTPVAESPSASSTPSTSPSPSPTPSEEPTQSPTPTPTPSPSDSPTASPTASPTDPAPRSPRAALLSAQQVPGLNAQSSWTQGRTAAVGTTSFGVCQRFDALSIGALEGIQRDFRSGADRAGQQVLVFPDAQNAVRAQRVFEAWHRDCRSQVPGRSAQVRAISPVTSDADEAWWYLLSWEQGQVGRWEAFGLARAGARITVLRMAHEGQDHSYEPGQDPLERALGTAASQLG